MLAFLVSNCLGLLFLLLNDYQGANTHRQLLESPTQPPSVYRFDNPLQAYRILTYLDTYQSPRNNTFLEQISYIEPYRSFHLGLTVDNLYCYKHRLYFVHDPEIIFGQPKIFTDYNSSSLLRKSVVPEIGIDVQTNIHLDMDFNSKFGHNFDINMDVSHFFSGGLYTARKIGKQFSCLTQASNQIPGNRIIQNKEFFARALFEYRESLGSKPLCKEDLKYFPKIWSLKDKDQCSSFFEEINKDEYQQLKQEKGSIYSKIPEGKEDVIPLGDKEEETIRSALKNGEYCGYLMHRFLVQKDLPASLLLNHSEFRIRVYLLIASTNPLIAYYHDGFIISNPQNNKQGTQAHSTKTMEELQTYLLENKITKNRNWINTYLRFELKKVLVHLVRMIQAPLVKISTLYELQSVDFMLDDKLNLWFLEADAFPELEGTTGREKQFFTDMLKDHFEIVTGLLRSRTKRIIQYINRITKEKKIWEENEEIFFDNFLQIKEEFQEVIKNSFESEFEPRSLNGFSKIVDETVNGTARYNGLLQEGCIENLN